MLQDLGFRVQGLNFRAENEWQLPRAFDRVSDFMVQVARICRELQEGFVGIECISCTELFSEFLGF